MRFGTSLAIPAAPGMAAGVIVYARYRHEMKDIKAVVEAGETIANTSAGPIEYAEEGATIRCF